MKKTLLVLSIFSLFCFGTQIALAHEKELSGTIDALMYIDPHDGLIEKAPAVVHVDFTDTANKFTIDTCDCLFAIKDNGQTIGSYVTKDSSLRKVGNNVSFPFSFPHAGKYTLEITATPSVIAQFEAFDLYYEDIEVLKAGALDSGLEHFRHHLLHFIVLGGGVIVGFVYALKPSKKVSKHTARHTTTQ